MTYSYAGWHDNLGEYEWEALADFDGQLGDDNDDDTDGETDKESAGSGGSCSYCYYFDFHFDFVLSVP